MRLVESIHASMIRSRTTRIVAVSQSCGCATLGSLAMWLLRRAVISAARSAGSRSAGTIGPGSPSACCIGGPPQSRRGASAGLLREQVTISYGDFIRGAGVSRGSLGGALREAESLGFIATLRQGRPSRAGAAAASAAYGLRWDERPGHPYAAGLDDFRGFFAGVGRLTPLPNQFFDAVLPTEPAATVKVVGCVLRHTVGFQDRYGGRRASAALSYARLGELGGVGGPRHIASALRRALERGYIRRVRRGTFDAADPRASEAAVYAVRWHDRPADAADAADAVGAIGALGAADGAIAVDPAPASLAPSGSEGEATGRSGKGSGGPVQKGKRDPSKPGSDAGSKREAGDRSGRGSTRNKAQRHLETQRAAAERPGAGPEGGATGVPSFDDALRALVDAGLAARTARALVAAAGREAVLNQVAWLPRRRPSRNPAGMLRRAIEEDWPEPRASAGSGEATAPGVAEFARHAYAGLAANDAEPVARPSEADLEAVAPMLAILATPPERVGEAGRRFGRFVRGRVGDRAALRPATVAAAVRAHGDAFAADARRAAPAAPAPNAPAAPAAGAEASARQAELASLAEEHERMRRERPGELAAFEAWRADRRADLAARLAESRLGRRVLARFDDEASRLEALGDFLSGTSDRRGQGAGP